MPQGPEYCVLDVEDAGEVTLVRVTCRRLWDDEEARTLGRQLSDLLAQKRCRQVVLSLASAEAVSSAAVGQFIALHKKVQALGGRLALCHVNPHLREGLDVAGLSQFFHIYGDELEAALSFGAPPPAGDGKS